MAQHTWKYPSSIVTLYPFICSMQEVTITLKEHSAAKWLLPKDLIQLDWAEADIPAVKQYYQIKIV